jgi:hypothetical protein
MQQLPVTTLHPDGETIVRLDYRTWPADPSSGLLKESVEVLEVRLEDGTDITEDVIGNAEWCEQINKFLTDPWFRSWDLDYTDASNWVGWEPAPTQKEVA